MFPVAQCFWGGDGAALLPIQSIAGNIPASSAFGGSAPQESVHALQSGIWASDLGRSLNPERRDAAAQRSPTASARGEKPSPPDSKPPCEAHQLLLRHHSDRLPRVPASRLSSSPGPAGNKSIFPGTGQGHRAPAGCQTRSAAAQRQPPRAILKAIQFKANSTEICPGEDHGVRLTQNHSWDRRTTRVPCSNSLLRDSCRPLPRRTPNPLLPDPC